MRKTISFLSIFVLLSLSFIFTGCSQKSGTCKATKYTSLARQKATMRDYTVLGKRYHPTFVEVGDKMKGISSWYGPNFHGKQTSNGECYDMNGQTAAHKTWPMDTMVKVTNLENGKSTIVRINDRGPFVKGRIIDCSYTAGKQLGLDRMGIARVEIQVVGFAGKVTPQEIIAKQQKTHTQERVMISDFGVQVGAFRRYQGAQIYKGQYGSLDKRYQPLIKRFDDVDGAPLYRVWIMGFRSEEEARDFIDKFHLSGAFIIRQ
ncbi:septal ring lytic transglycosylase RlpA family protein [Sulfurovum sp. zt1-1]|uniref:Probable endolytic peptidoglycan transglycosylase RlpA n=1 Tax=Sulfurovum zhangzhouensis TaxID=3019067 RepID=A0ABT7QV11_9BACT|nr:septal ring lytic transglycosylase RlpA family protein [Sulfurovum zhangzhouensis]MDM5270622.1 septal ring lytic transglycosylase RlpA family protein [Sulfurovum zhangzhouensis]